MEIGCHLPTQGPLATREAVETFARESEQRRSGLALGQRSRHLPANERPAASRRAFPLPSDKAYLEAVVALAAAASGTTRGRS